MRSVGMAIVVITLLVAINYAWIRSGRSYDKFEMTSERSVFVRAGNYKSGNIVGIQPYMVPADYRNADALYRKLNRYLSIAKKNGSFTPATIVLFPEHIGTWLVAANEKASVYDESSSTAALRTIAMCHPLGFAFNYVSSSAADRSAAALFLTKGDEMAAAYQDIFGRLAKEYGATVVAGSIVLPSPRAEGGALKVGDGPLYNVSATFSPEGKLLTPLTVKRFPVDEEKTFLAAGSSADIPVFATPAGNLATLICADSWYEEGYEALKSKSVDVLAIPSYLAGNNLWNKPWQGYNGGVPPANVAAGDIGSLTEGEAWQKYGLPGRSPLYGFKTGINIFLRGQLWDLGTNGHPLILSDGEPEMITIPADGAAIVNLQF